MSDDTDSNVVTLEAAKSRQVLRAETRAALKAEHRKESLEKLAVDDARIAKLLRARHMLFALLKQSGRARIDRRLLDSINLTDTMDIKVQENGDLVVTFVEGR